MQLNNKSAEILRELKTVFRVKKLTKSLAN